MEKYSKSNKVKIALIVGAFFVIITFVIYRVGTSFLKPGDAEESREIPELMAENSIIFYEAHANIGKDLWVVGVIDHVFISTKGNHFLNFCADFRECPFSAVIFSDSVKHFEDDIESWSGREIYIYGEVSVYEGRSQIIVERAEQVVVGEMVERNDGLDEMEGMFEVINVIDGDTIMVKVGGVAESVRLIGINAPEVASPHSKEECYGEDAKVFLKEIISGEKVFLKGDDLADDRDRYNRLLRYVYLEDGTMVNVLLLEEGYAFLYEYGDFVMLDDFFESERKAREDGVGVWGEVCKE